MWFAVDDNLTFHPKVVEAGNAAMGLWVRAGSWSAANLTDGFIPTRIALQLGTKKLCYSLVENGLWEDKPQGYQFHNWDALQPSKKDVLARRKYERERKAQQRAANGVPAGLPQGLRPESLRPFPSPRCSHLGDEPHVSSRPAPPKPAAAPATKPKTRADPFAEMADQETPEDRTHYIDAAKNGMPQVRAALTKKPQPL